MAIGRARWKLATGKRHSEDVSAFDVRNHQSKRIQGMRKVFQPVGAHDERTGGIFNLSEFLSQRPEGFIKQYVGGSMSRRC